MPAAVATRSDSRLKSRTRRGGFFSSIIFTFLILVKPDDGGLGVVLAQQGDVASVGIDGLDRGEGVAPRAAPKRKIRFERNRGEQQGNHSRHGPGGARRRECAAEPLERLAMPRLLFVDAQLHGAPERLQLDLLRLGEKRALQSSLDFFQASPRVAALGA